MGLDILIGALILMLGGSSAAALKEKRQLADAHVQTTSLQTTVAQLQTAEGVQATAQAKEDADRKAKEADIAKQAAIRGTYHAATSYALKASPPDVDGALRFNTLAIGADDPLSGDSMAQGQALAVATMARQAQLIADLQAQLKDVKDDNAAKTAAIAQDVKQKQADTVQIATLTGTVAIKTDKLEAATAEKKDLLSQFTDLTAKYGQWVFWSVIIGGVVFVGAHLGLFTHLRVKGQLAVLTATHAQATQTIAMQAAVIDAHAATIKTLASNP